MRSKPENGIESTPWMPLAGSTSTGFCGHRQHDDRHVELRRVDLLDELGALDPALEQGVDEHDVRAELADLGERLAAVGQDVEQLHGLLRVEQAADVLGDLRHVLDDQQARLVTRTVRHGFRRYHALRWRVPDPSGPGAVKDRVAMRRPAQRRSATRTARSAPGPIGARS